MNARKPVRSYEYKNDFLYIVVRQAPDQGSRAWLFCCGINTSRFDPLCWGKAGICSNPAFKGLQLLRADVVAFSLDKKLKPLPAVSSDCGPMVPPGHGWYRENLVLGDAAPEVVRELLEFSVNDLVKTVLTVCAPEAKLPEKLPNPPALQAWLETFSVKDYVAAAPPPIARKKDQVG